MRALHAAVTSPLGPPAAEDAAAAGLSAPAALLAERAPSYAGFTQEMLHQSVGAAFAAAGSRCGALDLGQGARGAHNDVERGTAKGGTRVRMGAGVPSF